MKCLASACIVLLSASAALAQNQFVYSNNNVSTGQGQPPNTVSAFLIGANGTLTQIAGSPFKTGGTGGGNNIDPEEIAIATQNGSAFLYAANDGSGTISAFRISSTNGSLGHVAGSPFLADPRRGLLVSHQPRWKFSVRHRRDYDRHSHLLDLEHRSAD
jgi:6-phosphogluconolactonase (cycloisomerase 2 family)